MYPIPPQLDSCVDISDRIIKKINLIWIFYIQKILQESKRPLLLSGKFKIKAVDANNSIKNFVQFQVLQQDLSSHFAPVCKTKLPYFYRL
jgi:hypothetical protein